MLGDPAGIGPELIAKLLSEHAARCQADVLLFADPEEGMRIAGAQFPYRRIDSGGDFQPDVDEVQLVPCLGGASRPFARAEATANGGRYSLDTLEQALATTTGKSTDAVVFGPLNKTRCIWPA